MENLCFEWTGDLSHESELRVEEWYACCSKIGQFRAELYPEGHAFHDPTQPLVFLESWHCYVNRDGTGVYASDVGGNLICGGQQCRTICETIIRVGLGHIDD